MDVKRVLIFREIARAGSISRAARGLGWTQPALSQHLQALEREVGCALLLRGAGGVELTEPGRVLLARADALAGELHMAGEELAELTALRGGRVRLAAYPSAAATLLPRVLADLARRHPDVEVHLTEAEPPEAAASLEAGEADVALVFGYDEEPARDRPLSWSPLSTEAVHLVVARDHRLAERAEPGPLDLVDESWIVGCERCRAHAVDVCARAGFAPRVRHVSDDYVVVQNLVAVGLGVTLLPQTALAAYRHPDVVVRASPAWGRRESGVLHRPGAERVPATAALLTALAEHATPGRG